MLERKIEMELSIAHNDKGGNEEHKVEESNKVNRINEDNDTLEKVHRWHYEQPSSTTQKISQAEMLIQRLGRDELRITKKLEETNVII